MSETPGTPALISDCNVTDKSDVHLQELASLGAHVYINYLSSPKIHPVSKQTTNHELQQGKSQPDVFISCALAAMRSHLYRTLTCILKWYPKAGKNLLIPTPLYTAALSPQCRSINYNLPRGFNRQCCCWLSEPSVKNASVRQLCVPRGTDIIVGDMTGVEGEQWVRPLLIALLTG